MDNVSDYMDALAADTTFCGHCAKVPAPGEKLLRCARCKDLCFCSRECQKLAWKCHRKVCVDQSKRKPSMVLGELWPKASSNLLAGVQRSMAYAILPKDDPVRLREQDEQKWSIYSIGIGPAGVLPLLRARFMHAHAKSRGEDVGEVPIVGAESHIALALEMFQRQKRPAEALVEFVNAANLGSLDGQMRAAVQYLTGMGVTQNSATAMGWYTKAAAQGCIHAMYEVAMTHHDGSAAPADQFVATSWWKRAAENGHMKSQYEMGLRFHGGQGVDGKDPVQAFNWFLEAASNANCWRLVHFLGGDNILGDPTIDVKIASMPPSLSTPNRELIKAQCEVGTRYTQGNGVAKDEVKAVEWLTKAALSGSLQAQLLLGQHYSTGSGVALDQLKASVLCLKLAGTKYCSGAGHGLVQWDIHMGIWLVSLADGGDHEAQYLVALCCFHTAEPSIENCPTVVGAPGESTDELLARAVQYLHHSVVQGNVKAQRELGWCYFSGTGVAADPVASEHWFQKASDEGDADSEYCLQVKNARRRCLVRRQVWLNKAMAEGRAAVQRNLPSLEELLQ